MRRVHGFYHPRELNDGQKAVCMEHRAFKDDWEECQKIQQEIDDINNMFSDNARNRRSAIEARLEELAERILESTKLSKERLVPYREVPQRALTRTPPHLSRRLNTPVGPQPQEREDRSVQGILANVANDNIRKNAEASCAEAALQKAGSAAAAKSTKLAQSREKEPWIWRTPEDW